MPGAAVPTTRFTSDHCNGQERRELGNLDVTVGRPAPLALALRLRLLSLGSGQRGGCAWRAVTSQANTSSGFPQAHLQML